MGFSRDSQPQLQYNNFRYHHDQHQQILQSFSPTVTTTTTTLSSSSSSPPPMGTGYSQHTVSSVPRITSSNSSDAENFFNLKIFTVGYILSSISWLHLPSQNHFPRSLHLQALRCPLPWLHHRFLPHNLQFLSLQLNM